MMGEYRVGAASDLGPGSVRGAGPWVVVNVDGERIALSRRCRHLPADLADGHIDEQGCLVCPWHKARYDAHSGRMIIGPQGSFGLVPGSGSVFTTLTRFAPLRHADLVDRGGHVLVVD